VQNTALSAFPWPPVETKTHCPYCALQCGTLLTNSEEEIIVKGNTAFPVNKGGLCVKGWTAAATLSHSERLHTPLARLPSGEFEPISWDNALGRIAEAFLSTQARYGRDTVGVFGGGSLTNEKAYLLGKFARVALRSKHIDYNGRFCMSSAAAASLKAFGIDRGLPFPIEDIAQTRAILLIGSNAAETLPPIMQYHG
jgi:assimilatory nitrate reductase catalytic subunit